MAQVTAKSPEILLAQVRKFKDIFSKSVYENLLVKIESANSALRILVGDAVQRERRHRRHHSYTRPLARQRAFRRHAKALRVAFLDRRHWNCTADHSHKVEFFFNEKAVFADDDDRTNGANIVFRISVLKDDGEGQELEAIPIPAENKAEVTSRDKKTLKTSQNSPRLTVKKEVQFALLPGFCLACPGLNCQRSWTNRD